MKTVIIGTSYNSSAADASALSDTQIGIFEGISPDHFVVACGRNDKISPSIAKKPSKLVLKRIAPIASVKQAVSVQFSYFGASSYDEFIIRTNIAYYQGNESRNSNAKVYSVLGIYADAPALSTAFAAVINADTNGEFDATVSGNTVVITPKDKNASAIMNIAAEFVPYSGNPSWTATVTQTAAQRDSSGYRDDVRKLEASAQYPTDRTRTESKFAALFDESNSYGSYPLETYYIGYHNFEHISGSNIGKAFAPLNELYVLLPTANAQAFETAIETLFGVSVTNGLS